MPQHSLRVFQFPWWPLMSTKLPDDSLDYLARYNDGDPRPNLKHRRKGPHNSRQSLSTEHKTSPDVNRLENGYL